jgi:DNA-binding NarL/FixJ family response regulator
MLVDAQADMDVGGEAENGRATLSLAQQLMPDVVVAHKANAMNKLELANRIDVVRYALLRGWLQET